MASGIVEEKASRVVELLLAAVRPSDLLGGKILGIGLVALTQVLAAAVAAAAAALAVGSFHLPHGTLLTGASLVVWFVLGYALFSSAFAATATLAGRQEDLLAVNAPLYVLLAVGYFAALIAVGSPDSPLVRVLSLLPPLAPLLMPLRAAAGDAAPWEVPVAILLNAAAVVGLIRLAGFIYCRGILQGGGRLSLRQVLAQEAPFAPPRPASAASPGGENRG